MRVISIIGKFFLIIGAMVLMFASVSCVILDTNGNFIPPGQEKKITGEDNAKNLAPGKDKNN